jgi:hypothetical protein
MKAGVRAALARAGARYWEPIRIEAIHGDAAVFIHAKKNQSAELIGMRYIGYVCRCCLILLSEVVQTPSQMEATAFHLGPKPEPLPQTQARSPGRIRSYVPAIARRPEAFA